MASDKLLGNLLPANERRIAQASSRKLPAPTLARFIWLLLLRGPTNGPMGPAVGVGKPRLRRSSTPTSEESESPFFLGAEKLRTLLGSVRLTKLMSRGTLTPEENKYYRPDEVPCLAMQLEAPCTRSKRRLCAKTSTSVDNCLVVCSCATPLPNN